MNKSESITNITSAILNVMADVKGIDKNIKISSGSNSYNGVADHDVKKIIGESMQKNGLSILPIDIEETAELNTWEEVDEYSKLPVKPIKRRQSVFTKVKTTYLLAHTSGEFITIVGYGHGIDSQDKSAGKATTYALKYALLYAFMVPTGKIDDADNSNKEIPIRQTTIAEATEQIKNAKDIISLKAIWNNNKHLQSDNSFNDLIKARRHDLETAN